MFVCTTMKMRMKRALLIKSSYDINTFSILRSTGTKPNQPNASSADFRKNLALFY